MADARYRHFERSKFLIAATGLQSFIFHFKLLSTRLPTISICHSSPPLVPEVPNRAFKLRNPQLESRNSGGVLVPVWFECLLHIGSPILVSASYFRLLFLIAAKEFEILKLEKGVL
jgi:hypothetical protein